MTARHALEAAMHDAAHAIADAYPGIVLDLAVDALLEVPLDADRATQDRLAILGAAQDLLTDRGIVGHHRDDYLDRVAEHAGLPT